MAEVGKRSIIWQGGEHDFCLAAVGDILAVEGKCGFIAVIYNRLANQMWGLEDIRQPIRQGLIGGGMPVKDADSLVDIHVMKNPRGLAPSVIVAMAVIEAVLIGVPDDPVGKKKPTRRKRAAAQASSTTTGGSDARPSSASPAV